MNDGWVLIISHDVVHSRLAGPGIRYRELARVLSQHFRVTLAVPGETDLSVLPFAVWPYQRDRWDSLAPAANQADVLVACGDTLADFPALAELRTPLVIDGYDPHTLETLALWAGEALPLQTARHDARLAILKRQCQAGDFFICASERQRDWWLGLLEQQGRINPQTYARDPSLRRLIDVVPYGLPPEPPHARRPVLRGVWPGLGPEDPIILWGGGLWEWLDPLTALRATRRLADRGLAIRLVFPGTRHPNPDMPDMPIRAQTLALSDELGLTGTHAFFGDWVPHEDWPAVLLEADVGLSLHPDTVEARLAYRSRVLDYIWAGLPLVVTRGDAAADLVAHYDLGLVVGFGDDTAVAEAIAQVLGEACQGTRPIRTEQFETARQALTWERACQPLIAFCQEPRLADDKAPRQPSRAIPEPMRTEATAEEMPAISVIILTWNGAEYIDACLTALLAQEPPASEIIVVDNSSTDGTPDLVAERFPGVRLIRNIRNVGFAAGNNLGMRAATGDLLLLLNQDTEVHTGFLASLARTFDDPAIGIAGCKLLYPDGTIQHAGGFLYRPRDESDHVGRHAPDDGRFDRPVDCEFVTAAALAISRAALARMGPLDEGFAPAYYEDADWCYRARAAGFRVVYQPQAVVTHHESTATNSAGHERRFALNQGRIRFAFKHRPLDRLRDEFGPAESAWIAAMDRGEDLMAARRSYLHTLLTLPDILAFRESSEKEAEALHGLLADLRAMAVAGLATLSPPEGAFALAERERARLLQSLEDSQTLREHVFASEVPVVGGLIAAVRRLWNSVATKWYVRPILQQQSAFNEETVRYLQNLERRLEGQSRDVAENIRELTALAERLTNLERPAPDHRRPRADND